MNKVKYVIVNGDVALGIIYESPEYGRTIVIEGKLDLNSPVSLWDIQEGISIVDMDFTKFIWEMLPKG
jgi:hypothetical protein